MERRSRRKIEKFLKSSDQGSRLSTANSGAPVSIEIPEFAEMILSALSAQKYEAFVVGGCVRDSILGRTPRDWDICTSARPDQVHECLVGSCHVIGTGIKHGTVTVAKDGETVEVTTFRIDGKYSDNRRPDRVRFVRTLEDDLARRDFTINAMAYNHERGLVDYFDGLADLVEGRIRAVGDPEARFQEDALRIMRALRFAAFDDFKIEKQTAASLHANKELLRNVAPERVRAELIKMLEGSGSGIDAVLSAFADVVAIILPEIIVAAGVKGIAAAKRADSEAFYQWRRNLVSMRAARRDPIIRLALLLRGIANHNDERLRGDIITDGKILTNTINYSLLNAETAAKALRRLRFSNTEIKTVYELLLYHNIVLESRRSAVKQVLNMFGEHRLRQLIIMMYADASVWLLKDPAVGPDEESKRRDRLYILEQVERAIDEINRGNQCYRIRDLAVDGHDIIAAGVPEGVGVGDALEYLLYRVMNGQVENEKSALLGCLGKFLARWQ
ncbi:MAG: tRNA nucleotidyltransferase [Clostridiales Family XIII bacterium]|jgi:tRNA nucleotidyltransferase (CCA-adding enzyme)|nr:tRNA nucleotidyltransferase [Clostridiales Family XIII bacterium]